MDLALTNSMINKPNPQQHQIINRINSSAALDSSLTTTTQQHSQASTIADLNNRRNKFGTSRTMTNLLLHHKRYDSNNNPHNGNGNEANMLSLSLNQRFTNSARTNRISNIDEFIEDYDSINIEKRINNLIGDINLELNTNLNRNTALEFKLSHAITVRVYLVFLKIGEIDTIKERFQADAYIESYWEDNNVDPNNMFDPRCNWNPEIHIENAIGDIKQEIRYKAFINSNNNVEIHEMRSVKGIFWERLELWDFPLDVQELSITVSTSRNSDEIIFESNPTHPCSVNTDDFLNQQEWNLFSHINTSKKSIADIYKNCTRPCYSATALVGRKPGYFIYNAYMLVFFVSALGFVPFSFSVSNNHFRIQVTSLLILTSVNFRWIVTQRLPSVSYLTTLDKYAIGALIFLVLLCAWHSLIGSSVIYDNDIDNKERVDQIVLYILSIIYILYHIVYFTTFYLKYRRYEILFEISSEFDNRNLTDDANVNTPNGTSDERTRCNRQSKKNVTFRSSNLHSIKSIMELERSTCTSVVNNPTTVSSISSQLKKLKMHKNSIDTIASSSKAVTTDDESNRQAETNLDNSNINFTR